MGKIDQDARPRVHIRWGVEIPTRDGVILAATLYLPPGADKPCPAIFTLTPYVAQRYHSEALFFAEQGFAFLTVDVRGRGNSGGVFEPFLNEAHDGHDAVEWIARQDFCDGKVAMWGGSYGGHAQWAAARGGSAHLATIVPFASPHLSTDFPFPNNMGSAYLLQWLSLVAGRASQDEIFYGSQAFWNSQFIAAKEAGIPFEAYADFLGFPSALFREWLAHREPDAYWSNYNPNVAEYAAMALPVLTITGAYDGDQPGALAHYRAHIQSAGGRSDHYLIIGPWHHAGTRSPTPEIAGLKVGPASLLDLRALHVGWYQWAMGQGPRPEFLKDRVAYYVTGAERWRFQPTLEAITSMHMPLYLTSDGSASDIFGSGRLSDRECGSGSDGYIYDPLDLTVARRESQDPRHILLRPTFPADDLTDQASAFGSAGRRLVYHSNPFAHDIEISGFFSLHAWISIDRPDADFQAEVYEVDESGGAVLLSADKLRARYREGHAHSITIDTAEPLLYRFERFTFVARMLRRGCRLRLVFGPMDSLYAERNLHTEGPVSAASAEDSRPVTVKLFHGRDHATVLNVPIARAED